MCASRVARGIATSTTISVAGVASTNTAGHTWSTGARKRIIYATGQDISRGIVSDKSSDAKVQIKIIGSSLETKLLS